MPVLQGQAARKEEFKRNAAFCVILSLVAGASFLVVLEKLRDILIPLIWAFFFALPILSFSDMLEIFTTALCSKLFDNVFRSTTPHGPVHFTRDIQNDAKSISLDMQSGSSLEGENRPGRIMLLALRERLSRRSSSSFLKCLDKSWLSYLWTQRVRITSLIKCPRNDSEASRESDELDGEVGLIIGRTYFVDVDGVHDEGNERVQVVLYLDRGKIFPAILEATEDIDLRGTLELDHRSALSWFLSTFMTLIFFFIFTSFLVGMIKSGISSVAHHTQDYITGTEDMLGVIGNMTRSFVPAKDWDGFEKDIQKRLQEFSKEAALNGLKMLEGLAGQLFLFALYLMFWILEPIPVNDSIAKVFKDYLFLKTVVCLLFAGVMAVTLIALECPIWSLYFFLAFILNYIPEIGSILAGILMLPGVLLDGGVSQRDRYMHTIILVIVGILAKIVTGNVIEVYLYQRFGGDYMRLHPVVIFVFFTFCGYQLGTTGAFIAIPILAALKYYLVSSDAPTHYLGRLLTYIEGDEWALHKTLHMREYERRELANTAGDTHQRQRHSASESGSEMQPQVATH